LAGCGSSGTATGTPTGPTTGTLTLVTRSVTEVSGTPGYLMDLTATFSGTYTGSGAAISITDGALVAEVRLLSGSQCVPTGGVVCTVVAPDLTGTGWATPTVPTWGPETVTIAVANGAFETTATDVSGTGCGLIGILNDNILDIDAVFEVLP
jgi:hypothetical protein